MRNNRLRESLHYFPCVLTLLSSPLLFTLSYRSNQSTVQKSMYLKSILNVLLIIAAVCALLYCSLFDNASKRTKCRFLSRAEGRGENIQGRGFKICQGFICIIVYYYLHFFERARFINLSTSAPGSRKTTKKQEQISSYQWVISVSLPLPLYLRRSRIFAPVFFGYKM